MVMGMIVGAVIALFCFVGGYFVGKKFSVEAVDGVSAADGEDMAQASDVNDVYIYDLSELERLRAEKMEREMERERERKKVASDLFRTQKGLLSYKKYVRE